MKRLRWWHLIASLLALVDLLYLVGVYWPIAEVNPYLVRDIHRTAHLLQGDAILVGPDLTAGGFAPGPFFYFLLMPVVAFTQNSKWIILYGLIVKWFAQIGFSIYFSRASRLPYVLVYAALAGSVFLLDRFVWFNNASFIEPLFYVIIILFCRYLKSSEDRINREFFVLSAALGLFMQVHLSFIFLVPLILLPTHMRDGSDIRFFLKVRSVVLGFILSMFPFWISVIFEESAYWGPIFVDRYFGVEKFFTFWLNGVSYTSQAFDFSRVSIEVLLALLYLFGRLLFYIVRRDSAEREKPLWRLLCLLLVYCLVLLPWLLRGSSFRYFTALYILAVLSLVYDFWSFARNRARSGVLLMMGIVGFSFLPRIILSSTHSGFGLESRCANCVRQIEMVCGYFNDRGYSFWQVMGATYEIASDGNENSLALARRCFAEEGTPGDRIHNRRFLLVYGEYAVGDKLAERLAVLPDELRAVYEPLKLREELRVPGAVLFSVDINGLDLMGGNLTDPYEVDPSLGLRGIRNVYQSPDMAGLYVARFCEIPVYCDLYVQVKYDAGDLSLDFRSRLFQLKYDLAPIHAKVERPIIRILCDGHPTDLPIVSVLGVSRVSDQNSTFLTPLVIQRKLSCREIQIDSVIVDQLDVEFYYGKTRFFSGESFAFVPLSSLVEK